MKIKLYTWTELHKMNNQWEDDFCAYGIQKKNYQKFAKHMRRVIEDGYTTYLVQYSSMELYIPHSFVKEIIHED